MTIPLEPDPAETVRCPHCHAAPGQPCANRLTGTTAHTPCLPRTRAAQATDRKDHP